MRIDFGALTNFLAIDYISNDGSDIGFLQVFDVSDMLLGSYTTASLSTSQFETMSFTSGTANIAYVLAGGAGGGSSGGLDNLQYERVTVTVPATLALLGLGLAGLGWSRKVSTSYGQSF